MALLILCRQRTGLLPAPYPRPNQQPQDPAKRSQTLLAIASLAKTSKLTRELLNRIKTSQLATNSLTLEEVPRAAQPVIRTGLSQTIPRRG